MDDIVKDSSIWHGVNAFAAITNRDYAIRVGMVRDITNLNTAGTIRYTVEVFNNNSQIPISCDVLNDFGGVWNYEEYIHRTYTHGTNSAALGPYQWRPGDMVLVAALNGDYREGIILGGLQHPGRTPALTLNDGIAYKSAFNGIVKHIDDNGAYTVTFNGKPTNIAALSKAPTGAELPDPQYNASIAGSYYSFSADGSFTVNDTAQSNPQLIKIDKPGGTITLQSGQVLAVLDKNAQSLAVTSKSATITASDSIKGITKDFSMEASANAKIKSPQVAIGTAEVELLEQLSKLIDKLGAVAPISPVGPCTPLMATPQWSDVVSIQAKIKQITGKF